MVIAPRRLERVAEIVKYLEKENIKFVLRSKIDPRARLSANIVLLDSLGELAKVYSIADMAFVGRSLFAPGGGHNLLEPVAQGKPVLHGPYIENNQKNDELQSSELRSIDRPTAAKNIGVNR